MRPGITSLALLEGKASDTGYVTFGFAALDPLRQQDNMSTHVSGVIFVEAYMVQKHGGCVAWREYEALRRRHEKSRGRSEGYKWLRKAVTPDDRQDVWEKYGEFMVD